MICVNAIAQRRKHHGTVRISYMVQYMTQASHESASNRLTYESLDDEMHLNSEELGTTDHNEGGGGAIKA